MPLDKLVLVVVCIFTAAIATLWLGVLVLATLNVPFAFLALIPAALVGYVVFKVITERLGNAEDDHYDRMEH